MAENIFLFIPNLIGYARVVLGIISFYYMPFDPIKASICYLLSGLLDAFDGWAARRFNQGTSFGAVLDMVTDRCATTCLLMTLCLFYPSWMLVWQCIVALDISSHWIQMYSALVVGDTSHKVTDLTANPIMRYYYKRPILFTFCAANELFFASLYMLYFTPGPTLTVFGYEVGAWYLVAIVTFPVSFLKQVVSVVQLIVASQNIGVLDANSRANKEHKQ
ncbi:CDP-diacylglycerol--inositol 3-phosphatidyltransferase-like [Halichondria panicea]|uniref:CDP-diacylglycerol--inositol 3-phosphatidyltransferase-like n=1 Tax=Halichondria panicea TaxID=6063 RepID=UPI00312B4F41